MSIQKGVFPVATLYQLIAFVRHAYKKLVLNKKWSDFISFQNFENHFVRSSALNN